MTAKRTSLIAVILALFLGVTPAFAETYGQSGNQGQPPQNYGYGPSGSGYQQQGGQGGQSQNYQGYQSYQQSGNSGPQAQGNSGNYNQSQSGYGKPAGQGYSNMGGQGNTNMQSSGGQNQGNAPQGSQLQPVGFGVVTGVDQPENCLKVRKGPSSSTEVAGCARMGEKLGLSGAWSADGRWAQLADGNWVFGGQIQTDLKRPAVARSSSGGSGGYSEPMMVHDDSGSGNWTDTGIIYGPGLGYYGGGFYGRFGRGYHHFHHKH
jgi:hypothetical protein